MTRSPCSSPSTTWTWCSDSPAASSSCISAKSLPPERRSRSAPTRAYARCILATLEIRGLSAGYGRARVLFDVDLEARPGEVVALLGRNGAGKSTTLKAIMGLVPALGGEVRFDGNRLQNLEPHEIARLGLGYVPEDRRIFTDLTVAENLEVGRQPARGAAPAWTEERLFALFPALAGLRNRRGAR